MRYTRSLDLIDHEKLRTTPITIIGAGAIGSFTALSLAKMGAHNLTVYDHDTVEEHNIPNQFYRLCDVGKPKVEALAEIINAYEGIETKAIPKHYIDQRLQGIVITAVDSMDTRISIWNRVKNNLKIPFYIEARMGAEVLQVHTLGPSDPSQISQYESTLYPSEEALRERCTAKTILYTVLLASGIITGNVKKIIMNEPIQLFIIFDCSQNILIITDILS